MTLRSMITEALEELEQLQSPNDATPTHTLRYRGRTFPCVLSTERRGEELVVGGILRRVELTAKIRAALFDPILSADTNVVTADSSEVTMDASLIAPRPNKDIELTSRNTTYRIARVEVDGSEAYFSIDLVNAYTP